MYHGRAINEVGGVAKFAVFMPSSLLLNDTLCVGGRLQNSAMSVANIHPAILSSNHPVTDLIIKHIYEKEGHAGVNDVLAEINK